jgi:hypothetical protein
MRFVRMVTGLGVLLVGLVLASCGDGVATDTPAEHSYEGPLFIERNLGKHPGTGAAGDVVDCRHFGDGGAVAGKTYAEGATADSAEGALETGLHESIYDGASHGLAVAARTHDRVLYVLEVDGAARQAVIVHDGPATEGTGGDGWYVESWARCDWSELPPSVRPAWLLVWTDHDGTPVPTEKVQSYIGPDHCNWQSATFLQLGSSWHDSYVRNPPGELTEFLAGPYREHVALPDDAVTTPYEREGERLWLAADKMTAYVGSDTADVEAWPREVKLIGCA